MGVVVGVRLGCGGSSPRSHVTYIDHPFLLIVSVASLALRLVGGMADSFQPVRLPAKCYPQCPRRRDEPCVRRQASLPPDWTYHCHVSPEQVQIQLWGRFAVQLRERRVLVIGRQLRVRYNVADVVGRWQSIVTHCIRLFFKRRCWSFLGVNLRTYSGLKSPRRSAAALSASIVSPAHIGSTVGETAPSQWTTLQYVKCCIDASSGL